MNKTSRVTCILALLAAVIGCLPGLLYSQLTNRVISMDSLARFEAIPGDLAFDLLGLPGNTIQQPGTMSKLLASIQPVVTAGGSISPGVAISFAPYQMIMGDKLQLKEYINSGSTRLLSNFQLSLGSAPSREADSSQDWAVGFRINFLNTGDGRLDKKKIDLLVQSSLDIFAITEMSSEEQATPAMMPVFREINTFLVANHNALLDRPRDTSLIQKNLLALAGLAEKLESLNAPKQAARVREYITKVEGELVKTLIDSNKGSPVWNTTSLSLSAGTVFRASQSKIQKSDFDRVRAWIDGGVGMGDSQLLGQIGVYYQTDNTVHMDSTFITYAFMYRYGTPDIRLGLGAMGRNWEQGTLNLVAEIRVSASAWVLASFNREFAKGAAPTWNPALTIKTTGAGFGF